MRISFPAVSMSVKVKGVSLPRPSASVILVSPQNEILLLHRVQTSLSFPAAHVFPGGNISDKQDGAGRDIDSAVSHMDAPHYRQAALRELFEECGILLARNWRTGQMLNVDASVKEAGRKAVHAGSVLFQAWMRGIDPDAVADIDALIPFSHWITPPKMQKRYTTQMYIYFMPLRSHLNNRTAGQSPDNEEFEAQIPTTDGGIEVTAAHFLSSSEWIRLANAGKIILFPPQMVLLSILSEYLDPKDEVPSTLTSTQEIAHRRSELQYYIQSSTTPWTEKYICPIPIGRMSDGRTILGLHSPGLELESTGLKGELDRVVLIDHSKNGSPRNVAVAWRKELFPNKTKGNL